MSSVRAPGVEEINAANALLALRFYGREQPGMHQTNNISQPEVSSSDSSTSPDEEPLGIFKDPKETSTPKQSISESRSTTVVRLSDGGCIVRRTPSKTVTHPRDDETAADECQLLPTVQLSSRVLIAEDPDKMDWQQVLNEVVEKKKRCQSLTKYMDRKVDRSAQSRVVLSRRVKTISNSTVAPSEDSGKYSDFKVDEGREDMDLSDDESSSDEPQRYAVSKDMVRLGNGNAIVPSQLLKKLDWKSYKTVTRKLLAAVFSRRVLATHSLTGKRSPAFPNKPAKKKLNAAIVNDIVQTVVERCSVAENLVRTSITTKCADESKMFRNRQQNKKRSQTRKENVRPRASSSLDSDSSDDE